jgi:hypothetical protein
MPLMLPKQRGVRREASATGRLSGSYGTLLTASTAHAEPASKTELIAATSFDSYWVNVYVHSTSTAATITDSLLNIYIGGSGSEQLLIPNLLAGWVDGLALGNGTWIRSYGFPLRVPAGSRISATLRALIASDTARVWVELLGGDLIPHWVGTNVEAIGAVTTSSRGTQVTPGSSVEGTLTRLGANDAAATNVHDWGFVYPAAVGGPDTTLTGLKSNVDICTSTGVIPGLEDFEWGTNQNETSLDYDVGRFAFIPAGPPALYARIHANGALEAQSVIVYGVY